MTTEGEPAGEGPIAKPWYVVSFEELGGSEEGIPEPHWLSGEWPEWVGQAARDILSTTFPLDELFEGKEISPRALGGILGRKLAAMNTLSSLDLDAEGMPKAIAGIIVPEAGFPEQYGDAISTFFTQFEEGMHRAFTRATDADFSECVQFFEGFADGLKKPPETTERTNTKLLFLLLISWRNVEKQPSVRSLHALLCKLMGKQVVGDLKRFEKVCQRLGLKLRARGRPKSPPPPKFRHRKR